MVEVSGRLFTGTDGHAYVRPRMHPGEPGIGLREQAQLDTTTFRIRVTNLEPGLGKLEGSWHTIRGHFRGMSVEADLVLDPPAQWFDSWEDGDTGYAEPNSDGPTEWFLSPDRQAFLEKISDSFDERKDFGAHLSWGLNGTREGTFRVQVYMLAVNDSFARWAENYTPDDLLVRSFVRAV